MDDKYQEYCSLAEQMLEERNKDSIWKEGRFKEIKELSIDARGDYGEELLENIFKASLLPVCFNIT